MSFLEAQGMGANFDYAESHVGVFCRHSPRAALVVRSRLEPRALANGLRAAFAQLRDSLAESATSTVEAQFIAFHGVKANEVDVEVGIAFSGPCSQARGDVRLGSIPAGRYVSCRLPLSGEQTLPAAYLALRTWLEKHAEHGTGPVYTTLLPAEPLAAGSMLLAQRRISAGKGAVSANEPDQVLLGESAGKLAGSALLELARQMQAARGMNEERRPAHGACWSRSGQSVRDVMTSAVLTCQPTESLAAVAQRLWEHDIGALPVVGKAGGPIAMITDRDICMAAYMQGKLLSEVSVNSAMSHALYLCQSEDPLSLAEEKMASHQVHRLPVIDPHGALLGIISLSDIVRARTRTAPRTFVERMLGDVITTYTAITQKRTTDAVHASSHS